MPAPRVTLRLQIARDLMQRIQGLSHELDLLPSDLIEQAIMAELERHEAQHRREQAHLDALQHSVLAGGQSVHIATDAEPDEHAFCQLCLRAIARPQRVDGPLLCDACYALAQGQGAPAGRGQG